MSQNPKIYWARPITTYSRTHFDALERHESGEKYLTDEQLNMHYELAYKYQAIERIVYKSLTEKSYDIVDPGSQEVADSFEIWRNQSKENKAQPMPFFTALTQSCDDIIFTCFDDDLTSPDAPDISNRIGCGVSKEVDAVVNRENPGKVLSISVSLHQPLTDGSIVRATITSISYLKWPKNRDVEKDIVIDGPITSGPWAKQYVCLNYPQTKALLILQGYESRSSKHKENQ
jgi:hypothetical protein